MLKRKHIIWGIAAVIILGWCSLASGLGGWLLGYDQGKREMQSALLPESGVLVTRVEEDSPAAAAGILRGDMLTAVDGVSVADVPDLRRQLFATAPGDTVLLTFRRDRGTYVVVVETARHPTDDLPYLGIYYTARAESPADI